MPTGMQLLLHWTASVPAPSMPCYSAYNPILHGTWASLLLTCCCAGCLAQALCSLPTTTPHVLRLAHNAR
jgi:hypothetical protein